MSWLVGGALWVLVSLVVGLGFGVYRKHQQLKACELRVEVLMCLVEDEEGNEGE
jgi:hypothetical protein